MLLVVCVDVPHEDPEGIAAQLTQLQGTAAELKVAQLDATQPAHTPVTTGHTTHHHKIITITAALGETALRNRPLKGRHGNTDRNTQTLCVLGSSLQLLVSSACDSRQLRHTLLFNQVSCFGRTLG